MSNNQESTEYSAYLMRVWQNEDTGEPRVVLENAHTGERIGFASLKMLLVYLKNGTREPSKDKTVRS